LSELDLLADIVTTLSQNLKIPVTCKIRVLPKEQDTLKLALLLQNSGCQILTVHGRTKEQKKDKTGPNNFDIIKKIKETLKIPVFSNGGIENLKDVKKCLEYTGVDGVMVSEAILGNPALFVGIEPDPMIISREYLLLTKQYPHGLKAVRPHLYKFLHRELTYHTELRDFLAEASKDELQFIPEKLRIEQLKKLASDSSSSSSSSSTSSSPTSSSSDSSSSSTSSDLSIMSLNLDEEQKLPLYSILYKDIPTWYNRYTTYKNSIVNTQTEVETEIETDGFDFLFGDDDNKEEE